MNKTPLQKTIVALDNMSEVDLHHFLNRAKEVPMLKIGLEMFCSHGPDFIKKIHQDYQKEIFLDLKLHDIPNTVKKAIRALKGLPLKFLTIHLSGGREMINQAVAQAQESLPDTHLLGVSYLTSLAAEDMQMIWGIQDPQLAFTKMFKLALSTKIPGLVLSAQELALLNTLEDQSTKSLIKVCPGIRFADELKSATNNSHTQDQKRVATPQSALANGADYLVIGRSLTQAQDLAARISELQIPPI